MIGELRTSVAGPYNFLRIRVQDLQKIRYGPGSRPNFDTDSDPVNTIGTGTDPGKKGFSTRKIIEI